VEPGNVGESAECGVHGDERVRASFTDDGCAVAFEVSRRRVEFEIDVRHLALDNVGFVEGPEAKYEIGFAADVDDVGSMIRGRVDVDRDGRDDVLVELGRGASTEVVGVFGLGKSGLTQATYQDGTKARLLFAGSVRHGAAVECRSESGRAELVLRGISNYTADDQWDWSESVYTWSSKVLVLSSQRKGVIKVPHPFDPPPNEDAFWSFRCFGVDLF